MPGTSVSPGTVAAPGTMIGSVEQGPLTPPAAVIPNKLAARLLEDRSGSFGSDIDENPFKRPEPTVEMTRDDGVLTIIDEPSHRAAEEATVRDKPNPSLVDSVSTVRRPIRRPGQVTPPGAPAPVPGPPPGPLPGLPPAVAPGPALTLHGAGTPPQMSTPPQMMRESMPRVGAPGVPRPSAAAVDGDRRRIAISPVELAKQRRMRMVLAITGLTGLALISFAIALAVSGGPRSQPPADATAIVVIPLDAAAMVVPPPQPIDAAAAVIAPPDVDAGPREAYLAVYTKPPNGTLKVGDQTRTAPAQLIVPSGHVAILAELAGWADERRTVDLEPGEHYDLEIAFTKKVQQHHGPEMGKLTVRTNPYSDVYEGGNLIATTPFADRPMVAGDHALVFKNPKHPTLEKKITIQPGKTTKLRFDLP
jgi:hypothetical protein